jgi:hypothetical protein
MKKGIGKPDDDKLIKNLKKFFINALCFQKQL